MTVYSWTNKLREYRSGIQKWTIQRNWQQDEEKQNKNTTQYMLDTTIRKQLEVKTNRTSFLCGNRNGHHKTRVSLRRSQYAN